MTELELDSARPACKQIEVFLTCYTFQLAKCFIQDFLGAAAATVFGLHMNDDQLGILVSSSSFPINHNDGWQMHAET